MEGILEHEIIHRRPGYALFYVVSTLHEYELWLQRLFTQESLTMIPPVDLRTDRRFVFRIIGRPDDLQRAVADAGKRLPLDVERVGDYNPTNGLLHR